MAYHFWKMVLIAISFLSSILYAYYAAFLIKFDSKELALFADIDFYCQRIFIVDLLLQFFREH